MSHRHDGGEGCQSWLLLNGCRKKVCSTNDVPEFLGLSHPFLFLGTIKTNFWICFSYFLGEPQAPREKAPKPVALRPSRKLNSKTWRTMLFHLKGRLGSDVPGSHHWEIPNRKLLRLYWLVYWCLEKVVKIMGLGWGWIYIIYIYIHVYICRRDLSVLFDVLTNLHYFKIRENQSLFSLFSRSLKKKNKENKEK